MPSDPMQFVTRAFSAAICFVTACLGSLSAGENWPSYRGPSRQGHVDASNLPIHWSESENVAWKIEVAGKAWSSPVIWKNQVWLTNAPEEGSRLSALGIDKRSGKVLVKKRLWTVPAPQYCHPFNSYASPSPVIEEGRVYVSFGSEYNAALDTESGEVVWERTDFVCNHFRGPGSSPFIFGDLLILHFDGSDQQYVVALDKHTGKTVWKTDRTVDFQDLDPKTGKPEREGDWRKAYSTPIVADLQGTPVLISLGSMALYGYDPHTGKELWRLDKARSHSGACRPVIGGGLILAPMGASGELWAIRPDGKGAVAESQIEWTYKRAPVPRRPSVLLVDDLIFMVSDAGVAACLEAKTGKEVWTARVGGNFSASPIHANGKIYFFDQEGKTTVIDAAREYNVVAVNQLDGGFMASPAVSNNALYLRTRTHLYRIEN